MNESHHMPRDYGVVDDTETRRIVWYRIVNAAAGRTYTAHILGSSASIEPSPTLRALIEADISERGIEL